MDLPELTKAEKEALRKKVLSGMPSKADLARDPELAGIDAALRRAAVRAWRRAAQHSGTVSVYENGKVVRLDAKELLRGADIVLNPEAEIE
ncbi:MAG: hypothetical protein OXN23_04340 [Gammaproteobacteria bacterium]|nr:hypothetical protein [Gammaproteobacteria bacterium]MDE0302809.1 hypothetical protein [Gammaproteobacteria bacterium]MDE0611632.1 hypothetical protein [Gammaproteobacteria bacterium]